MNWKTKEITTWTRDDVLTYLYSIHAVEMYGYRHLFRYTDEQRGDLINEVYLLLCEVPEEKWTDLCQQGLKPLQAFVWKFVCNSLSLGGKTKWIQKFYINEIHNWVDIDNTDKNMDEDDYE